MSRGCGVSPQAVAGASRSGPFQTATIKPASQYTNEPFSWRHENAPRSEMKPPKSSRKSPQVTGEVTGEVTMQSMTTGKPSKAGSNVFTAYPPATETPRRSGASGRGYYPWRGDHSSDRQPSRDSPIFCVDEVRLGKPYPAGCSTRQRNLCPVCHSKKNQN